MAITYLPQAGSITEKNIADYWHGAMAGQAYLTGTPQLSLNFPVGSGIIYSSGLAVYCAYSVSLDTIATTVVLEGYATSVGSDSDLSVTLPANSLSYVYFVLDMAGGGTNTIGQRLVYSNSNTPILNGVLIATAVTGAASIETLTTVIPTRPPNYQAYPASTVAGVSIAKYANTERTTSDTTGVIVKQFCVEYAGVYIFSCDLKNASLSTTTCYVYAASTGDIHGTSTPQLTFTDTNSTYTTNTGTLALAEGDVVSVYLKTSNATYAGYIDQVSLAGYACVPIAPAFLIE